MSTLKNKFNEHKENILAQNIFKSKLKLDKDKLKHFLEEFSTKQITYYEGMLGIDNDSLAK
ncbi:hypothetical protein [Legionella sp. WA2022007384]